MPKIHGGVSPLLIDRPIGSLAPPFYLSVLHLQAMPVQGMARYKSFLFAFEARKPFRLLGVGERGLPLVTRPSVFHLHVAFVDQVLWEKERRCSSTAWETPARSTWSYPRKSCGTTSRPRVGETFSGPKEL